ncbi:hypothetical protein GGC64_002023 [Mycobacterium sp. OAS707]|uniref:DUF4352 domain-containing protein n=1 Tax=Mycobacterium sp. OAS707 TaxID=2663822 RepID=UPI00178ABAF6|nr:hypothetical protein [Mycobacterium sp. OAS707]
MPRHAATPKRSGRERALLVGMGVAVVAVVGAIVAGVILALRMNVAAPTVTAQTSSAAPSATAAVPGPTATEPTATDVARPDVPPAAMGQEVRDGDFSFVVTGVQRMDAVVNPEHPDIEKTAQGEYVVVQMTVTNTSAEPQTYSGSFNTLSDGGTVYKSDDEAWLYFGHLPPRLNPGDSFDTAVVFDVPKGTEVQSVDLHDGPTSTGVTVAL